MGNWMVGWLVGEGMTRRGDQQLAGGLIGWGGGGSDW